jgi:hypothetical protein
MSTPLKKWLKRMVLERFPTIVTKGWVVENYVALLGGDEVDITVVDNKGQYQYHRVQLISVFSLEGVSLFKLYHDWGSWRKMVASTVEKVRLVFGREYCLTVRTTAFCSDRLMLDVDGLLENEHCFVVNRLVEDKGLDMYPIKDDGDSDLTLLFRRIPLFSGRDVYLFIIQMYGYQVLHLQLSCEEFYKLLGMAFNPTKKYQRGSPHDTIYKYRFYTNRLLCGVLLSEFGRNSVMIEQ